MPLNVQLVNAQVKDPQSGQMTPAGLIGSDAISTINTAKNQAIAAIVEQGEDTIRSIPPEYTALSNEVDDVKTQIKDTISDTAVFNVDNLIIPDDVDSGYINPGTGAVVSSNSWSHTDYLPLRPGEKYANINVSGTNFAFYDIAKKFVDLRSNTDVCESNSLKSVIKAPDNIFYCRLSIGNANINTAIFSANALKTDHQNIPGKFETLDKKSFEGMNARSALLYESGVTKLNPDMYIRGSYTGANYTYSVYQVARRASSQFKEIYPFDIILTPDSNTTMLCLLYNADGTITQSGDTFTRNPVTIPKNTEFILQIARNADATIEEICGGVNVSVNSDGIPAYYFDNGYIEGRIDEIIDKSPANGFQFAFITDIHVDDNAGISPDLINFIRRKTNGIPFVISGGDIPTTVLNPSDPLDQAKTWQSWMNRMGGKEIVYQAQGNHDYLGTYTVEGVETSYNASYGTCRQFVMGNKEVKNINNPSGVLYYYFDIDTSNTRVIVLNDYDIAANKTDFHGMNGFSVNQTRWLLTEALNVENKNILIVSHQSYDPDVPGENYSTFAKVQEIIEAVANATTVSYGGVSYDFTNKNLVFLAHLCGHWHADASHVKNNALTIQTTCDKLTGTREAGTINEQAFDVFTIDLTSNKMYATRIGAGSDRVFDIYIPA